VDFGATGVAFDFLVACNGFVLLEKLNTSVVSSDDNETYKKEVD